MQQSEASGRRQVGADVNQHDRRQAKGCQDDPAERGSGEAGHGATDRDEGVGRGEFLIPADQAGNQGLRRGLVELAKDALGHERGVDDRDLAGAVHERDRKDAPGLAQVHRQHDAAAIPVVGRHPGHWADDQRRKALGDEGEASCQRRAGQLEDLVGNGDHQQPAAEARKQLTRPQQPEVPDPQGKHAAVLSCILVYRGVGLPYYVFCENYF